MKARSLRAKQQANDSTDHDHDDGEENDDDDDDDAVRKLLVVFV